LTIFEAQRIYRSYHHKINPSEEERFQYLETLDFLIHETKDPDYMVELGAAYYEQRHFDLALKYYEMAAEYDHLYAISNLGYIWYYGRTGERNYEKAFYYFDKARSMGDLIAAYKVADMYKNGYDVQQDVHKYQEIIEDLYPKVKNLGLIEAESFISIVIREKFDYTKWQREYFDKIPDGQMHENALSYAKQHPYEGPAEIIRSTRLPKSPKSHGFA